ncbi:MAG: GTPase [Elusimicrobia bacterium]|nr:GTPase [Elusimicrobiota bacterium]
MAKNMVLLGAAGRDFHNFNVCYRNDPEVRVQAFTAEQIPNIAGRLYPEELAGPRYPQGIPILPEKDLPQIIREKNVEEVVFSYSDISHIELMHKASLALACGADFKLLSPRSTYLESQKPVVAVCAVRTGCGKSQTSRRVASLLKEMGKRVAIVRHPMPYGDLAHQICQRFAKASDLDRNHCTIEEREEYEPHLQEGHMVFAGVDYAVIQIEAEKEAEVILWDGGNNDLPFYRPDLLIVVADPHRPGHETSYHPGETNARLADVLILNKVDTAAPQAVQAVRENLRRLNPQARWIEASSPVTVEHPEKIRGKRVLAIEDGPTLTHGEMRYGAAVLAARQHGAQEVVDPRPYAQGSIREVYRNYPHLDAVLPAMGYGEAQMQDLAETIERVPCELVLIGTPVNLSRFIPLSKPHLRVRYELGPEATGPLRELLQKTTKSQVSIR